MFKLNKKLILLSFILGLALFVISACQDDVAGKRIIPQDKDAKPISPPNPTPIDDDVIPIENGNGGGGSIDCPLNCVCDEEGGIWSCSNATQDKPIIIKYGEISSGPFMSGHRIEYAGEPFSIGKNIHDIDFRITRTQMPELFPIETFEDTEGSNTGEFNYRQSLLFAPNTGTFILDENTELGCNLMGYWLFFSKYWDAFNYELEFTTSSLIVDSPEDIIGNHLKIMSGDYEIIGALVNEGGVLTGLQLEKDAETFTLVHYREFGKNGNDIDGTEVIFDWVDGSLKKINILYKPTDKVFLDEGYALMDSTFYAYGVVYLGVDNNACSEGEINAEVWFVQVP